MKKTLTHLMVLAVLMLAFFPTSANAENSDCDTSAQSVCVIEQNSNIVLTSKNAHEQLPMASTTKVMTAIIAIEQGNLDSMVTTADEAYGVEGSSIYLRKNEAMSLRDLLYGLMLRSGNDAAVAIAVHVGGSVEDFAKLMNIKAKEIGAINTNFVTPHGLPDDNHYTTAYDLSLICSYALKNNVFREIVSTRYHKTETGAIPRTMMNKNKLLSDYNGAIGIKTGYTKAAGKCLTFAAERNGMTVVGVVLNCPNMFEDSMRLMDYCFDNYVVYTVLHKGTVVMRTFVSGIQSPAVIITSSDIKVPVKKSEGIKLYTRIVYNDNIEAPMKKGSSLGKLEIYTGTALVASTELVLQNDLVPYSFSHYLQSVIEEFTA